MNRETQFALLIEMIENQGNKVLFNSPVMVKKTPHIHLFTAFGVMTDNKEVGVLDGEGNWHELKADQMNAEYIIGSLYQRLRLTEKVYVAKQDTDVNAMVVHHG